MAESIKEIERLCKESQRYSDARRAHVRGADRNFAELAVAIFWFVIVAAVIVIAFLYW